MLEADRLQLLKVRTSSEASFYRILSRKFAKLWLPRDKSYGGVDTSLYQAGMGGASHLWLPFSIFVSLVAAIICFLSVGVMLAISVFIASLYLMLERIVRFRCTNRRIGFVKHLPGFVSSLEMLLLEGKKLNSSFEYVLERAPEGVLRDEVSLVVANGTLKSTIAQLNNRIAGRETKLFSSSIFLMSGVYDIQLAGVSRLTALMNSSSEKLFERAKLRKSFYRGIYAVAVLCLSLDIAAIYMISGIQEVPLIELVAVAQIAGLLVSTEFADRIVG